ncbi:group II intron reverse transcriptase/maturase [Paenibacillus hexagrammi]|uniref:Group II intron reverse transcriptase/maturase n=1 Tax=Paenibacillus hexagrammi TaxID=2908839 RepID=A0ABY3SD82_9BACL|nr:group II intron reverse transcriptase/maturase [Paenibacillus sp. YPD9-1]UJF31954.1 group II intron reverse transcriptase/maturase [Paenibacillus sp. YPD9-1]UJF32441.1 group II intron reverse transcriptase/maturase [Paenibacillus sp. YPD9-1]UJF32525.1 group II intron reverse transcriptase/maturase [Paenibacillus sp. YPD9-1]UJF32992.1 group II intron reverse transcriptase/maturase [Paenibacillus sp. YPD9-1]UJF35740.1 group II intron reverse transcriptase/maturase [Paenibacillus sp. YPD9-1]
MKPKRRYYSLIDKIYQMDNLNEAWLAVKKNQGSGGIDGVSIGMFEKNIGINLKEIQRLLQQDRYKPDPVRRHFIEKENGKLRPLGIPTIRDRVCQQAVRQIIEPIFEQDFYYYSFGFRPGYSAHQAINTIRRAKRGGYDYVVDLDIISFFDEIPHELLMEKVRERITDGKVLTLIRGWLTAGVMEDDQFHETLVGSPQGGVISPLLANLYLNHFDWSMKEKGFAVVRYADDAVILCKTKERAEEAYQTAKTILEGELQLRMHPEKTKVVQFDEGFRFLGFDFWKEYLILPDAKVKKYKEKVHKITRRQQGNNLNEMMKKLNEVSRGFGNYFGIGNVKKKFQRLDEWTRMRVRAFMRKKKSTVSNRLIPNKVLEEAGMVFLTNLLTTRF